MFVYCIVMGRHKEWRKIAKRERRRLIRQKKAKLRENRLSPSHNGYHIWLKEQEDLELLEREQIEAINRVENEKWIEAEKLAIKQWKELQQRKEKLNQIRLEQEAKLKMERELEQKRREEEEKRLKEIEEEHKRKQQAFMEKLEQFLTGDSEEPPAELLVSSETKPNHEPCPFFVKTGCCRFGNQCSRNHQFPGISRIILAANFFTHIGINNAIENEYDADDLLEHEYSETYKDFKEFFYDVLPEFEKHGQILQFKVCNNYEKHLRGLQSARRCPKGRSCNFLHVFRNPNNLFPLNLSQNQESERKQRPTSRSWRWSESPEVEIPRRRRSRSRSRSWSRDRSRRESRRREERSIRDSKRRRHRSRSRRRSQESESRKK